MSRLHMIARSTINEGDDWARCSASGSVKSDNVETERSLSYDFGGVVDRTADLAYNAHVRSRRD